MIAMASGKQSNAAYQQIADQLRAQIDAGDLPPGSPIPREADLQEQFGVARGTIRQALDVLRGEGRIITVNGRGSHVRPTLPVRRLAMSRYATAGDGPIVASNPDFIKVEACFDEVDADGDVAGLLEVEPGTGLLRRQYVYRTLGTAQQLTTSYLLYDMVAGTPVADPANEPWAGGTMAQLRSLGHEVTAVEESVRARMPSQVEAETLGIKGVTPVLSISRRMLAGARPVEAAVDIVIPADRVVLDYRIELP